MRSVKCQQEPNKRQAGAVAPGRRPASDLRPTAYSLQPSPAASRRGISLLEVLISMFVMLFGLMGVAAIFPVGNHYAVKGEQFDRGAALAGTAFAELKSRGMLQTAREAVPSRYESVWLTPQGIAMFGPTGRFAPTATVAGAERWGHAFVIDPVGAAETIDPSFPVGGGWDQGANPAEWRNPPTGGPGLAGQVWPLQRVTFASADLTKLTARQAELVSRLHDDLSVELPDAGDRPGVQRWALDNNGTPNNPRDDIPLARDYVGSYSWLATVLPLNQQARSGMQPADSLHGSFLYEVSVAVFFKRDLPVGPETERSITAELYPGGDLLLYADTGNVGDDIELVDAATKDIRAGQWLALTGVHPISGNFLLKWYRILSIDIETDADSGPYNAQRRVMLDGPDWPPPLNASAQVVPNLRAILLPGVIGVSTQTIPLEPEDGIGTGAWPTTVAY